MALIPLLNHTTYISDNFLFFNVNSVSFAVLLIKHTLIVIANRAADFFFPFVRSLVTKYNKKRQTYKYILGHTVMVFVRMLVGQNY